MLKLQCKVATSRRMPAGIREPGLRGRRDELRRRHPLASDIPERFQEPSCFLQNDSVRFTVNPTMLEIRTLNN
jgi:hypothetical protein